MRDEQYRRLLQLKAEDLKQSLRRRGEMLIERAPDQLDETLLAAERESAVSDLERTYRLLRQVDFALARIECGTYGLCARCESPIGEKRLKAVPWALYCIECQESVDRLHEHMDALRRPAA
jgi:DnaK suppressor protein